MEGRRSERRWQDPDLGVLAVRVLLAVQRELFARLAAAGHGDLRPRHGAVLAYLDEEGIRATDLAALSGRQKQVVGRLIDEMEGLGYVERRPDPSDRRAKLVVPTERGREAMRLADEITLELERRHARTAGSRSSYERVRRALRSIVLSMEESRRREEGSG